MGEGKESLSFEMVEIGGMTMRFFEKKIPITEEQIGRARVTSEARLDCYLLEPVSVAPERPRPAIIICPGGGYGWLSPREAEPIAMQYLSMGYQAFVLYYSVAPERFPVALMELASSVKLVREQAQEWNVDAQKIIVSGFSAGGHLACSLGVFWKRGFLCEKLGVKPEEIQPNGMILCYPVISSGEFAHRGSFENLLGEQTDLEDFVSLEKQVSEDTPRTFLWHTATDGAVLVENSLLFAKELSRHGVNFELHIYPVGGHGLSLATEEVAHTENDVLPICQDWINQVKHWV